MLVLYLVLHSVHGHYYFTDVANPLIGDIAEYERFVNFTIEKKSFQRSNDRHRENFNQFESEAEN